MTNPILLSTCRPTVTTLRLHSGADVPKNAVGPGLGRFPARERSRKVLIFYKRVCYQGPVIKAISRTEMGPVCRLTSIAFLRLFFSSYAPRFISKSFPGRRCFLKVSVPLL